MKKTLQITFLIIAIPGVFFAQSKHGFKFKQQVIADYKNLYSSNNLWKFALGLGYAGFYANTSFDKEVQDFYVEYIKSDPIDDISKVVKPFGNGRFTVPVYLTAALIGEFSKSTTVGVTIGTWGQRCTRALIVGAPPVLVLQILLGASRPEEKQGSRWRPFEDDNGASGHSFMGAVPFLVAAKMSKKSPLKYPLYFASTLTGISRINDNKHYFSQSFLGWWMAFLAVNSIDTSKIVLVPSVNGVRFSYYF